jgi:hypothetical protein
MGYTTFSNKTKKMIEYLSTVRLKRPILGTAIPAGTHGVVVRVYQNPPGYEVEFVDGSGHTVALITVNADDVRPIAAGELLHARRTA